jgi:6-pyruvoyltetrahydropterin/6-carboxytetrahydropterin synthase
MKIGKTFTFDAAHRLQDHEGKCRNLHGHTYSVVVTLEGELDDPGSGRSGAGMVLDFSRLGEWWKPLSHVLDHAALLQETDPLVNLLTLLSPPVRITTFRFPPTAECLADWIYDDLASWLAPMVVHAFSVRVYETPTSWAER